ncbi:hypothetical protein [Pantoea ananatis]|uniref:hypothetical protein n=1 Tax=Pantoea ananas TaxID=553 RepID=UPI0007632063|nr:hypothetical protein [Pantoea ananatis]AMB74472.1 hypothetical protein AW734_06940 [Pantoea ananatis]
MKTHESQASRRGSRGQQQRATELLMQVHENRYMKCAGVAGLRARAEGKNGNIRNKSTESLIL